MSSKRYSKIPHKYGGKISFVTRHFCRLDPLELQRELPREAPYAAVHKRFLYKLRLWTIANAKNPQCQVYFRSDYAIYKEKRRQLRFPKYRMVIHPFSNFAMWREFFICLLWVTAFILDPFFGAFLSDYIEETKRYVGQDIVQLVLNCLFLVDIVVQFFLGFTVSRTKEIVLDHRRIVKQYLKGYFFYDIVPVLYGIVNSMMNFKFFKELFQLSESFHIFLAIPQLYCLRFVRIYSMAVYFGNILNYHQVRESITKCAIITLVLLIVIHWWTCALFLFPVVSYCLGYPFEFSWILQGALGTRRGVLDLYIECLLCTVCHFHGSGKGNILTENPMERLILAFILMCGLTCHIYVIAIILQLFGTINVSETKYEELIYQLKEYMVTKKLPQPLRKRLLIYYEYRFQKQFFMENIILDSLSEHLRLEVRLYGCRNLINKVKMFQGASKEVVGGLVAMLKHEIYLPDDQIISLDAPNENVYFISFGTVSVYLPNGKEAFHLEDGHHFGEVSVVLRGYIEEYKTQVVAIEITEVFYLDKMDFWYIVASHPEIADSLEKSALSKLAVYRNMITESHDSIMETSDILTALRKGHILDNRRMRR